jgi:hypothetical protein
VSRSAAQSPKGVGAGGHSFDVLPTLASNRWIFSSGIGGALAFAVLAAGAPSAAGGWEPERTLSDNSSFYAIAASDEVVHVFWGASPLRYARSTDEGVTFGPDMPLVEAGEMHPTGPAVARGSKVYVVFFRYVRQATDWCCPRDLGDLYLKRSTDGGLTWEPEQRLTSAGSAFRYDIAVSGSSVHLAWSDYRGDRWQIYYRRSTDDGADWLPEVELVPNVNDAIEVNRPQIASEGDDVHVTWGDSRDGNPPCYTMPACSEVYYKRSTDGGAEWEDDVRITFDGAEASFRPAIATAGSDGVVISFQSNRDGTEAAEQEIVRSDDNGSTWASPLRVTFSAGSSEHDNLVGAGSSVHLCWSEDSVDGTRHRVQYRESLDEGATWSDEEAVSGAIGGEWSVIADLATTSGYLHAFWPDQGAMKYSRRPLGASAPGDAGPGNTGDAGENAAGDAGLGGEDPGGGCGCGAAAPWSGALTGGIVLLALALVSFGRWRPARLVGDRRRHR